MKPFIIIFLILLLLIQYRLWFGDDGLAQAFRMKHAIVEQENQNSSLKQHNEQLISDIAALKHNNAAIENRARNDLGMIKNGETFYQIIK
jgi:cell division protein FtsB